MRFLPEPARQPSIRLLDERHLIVVEDLDVSGMVDNQQLARSINDVS